MQPRILDQVEDTEIFEEGPLSALVWWPWQKEKNKLLSLVRLVSVNLCYCLLFSKNFSGTNLLLILYLQKPIYWKTVLFTVSIKIPSSLKRVTTVIEHYFLKDHNLLPGLIATFKIFFDQNIYETMNRWQFFKKRV